MSEGGPVNFLLGQEQTLFRAQPLVAIAMGIAFHHQRLLIQHPLGESHSFCGRPDWKRFDHKAQEEFEPGRIGLIQRLQGGVFSDGVT